MVVIFSSGLSFLSQIKKSRKLLLHSVKMNNIYLKKQIFWVCGDESEMLPQFNDEMNTIDHVISELDGVIQTAIDENGNNHVLVIIQGDFNSTFHEVIRNLRQLRDNYIACRRLFEPVYVEYLQIAKDMNKMSAFRKTVNTWKGKVLTKFRIEIYMNEVKDKVVQLANENSIFYTILNEVKRFGSARSRIQWNSWNGRHWKNKLLIWPKSFWRLGRRQKKNIRRNMTLYLISISHLEENKNSTHISHYKEITC